MISTPGPSSFAAGTGVDSSPPPATSGPGLSVVICTRNRPRSLQACVRSVARQTVPPVEVIVVDDGELSGEDLRSLASVCKSARLAFVYLSKDVPGLPPSRNLAVRHARGRIVQFLDDDVTIEPDFCREIGQLYADDPAEALIGTEGTLIEPSPRRLGARIFEWTYRIAGWWALHPRTCNRPPLPPALRHHGRAQPIWNTIGATMGFRRSALLEQPFDEGLTGYALGEDRDLAYRLGRRGWLLRSRTARAEHRQDPAGRPDLYTFGRMAVGNYVRVMTRNGMTTLGDRLVIAYSLTIIALSLLLFSPVNPRRCLPQLLGMVGAGWQLGRAAVRRYAGLQTEPQVKANGS